MSSFQCVAVIAINLWAVGSVLVFVNYKNISQPSYPTFRIDGQYGGCATITNVEIKGSSGRTTWTSNNQQDVEPIFIWGRYTKYAWDYNDVFGEPLSVRITKSDSDIITITDIIYYNNGEYNAAFPTNYYFCDTPIIVSDKICVSGASIPTINGIYEWHSFDSVINGATYLQSLHANYLYPTIYKQTNYWWKIDNNNGITAAYATAYGATSGHLFEVEETLRDWDVFQRVAELGYKTWVAEPSLLTVDCTDVCITNSDKWYVNGRYTYQGFDTALNAAVYLRPFILSMVIYIYAWIFETSGNYSWRIGSDPTTSSAWNYCNVGNNLGNDYVFQLHPCEGNWKSNYNDAWNADPDMTVKRCEPVADPQCDRGIKAEDICCMLQCGQCGGSGCSDLPAGEDACCTSNIRNKGSSCNAFDAPCVIQPTSAPTTDPTPGPTRNPSDAPTDLPSRSPTKDPSSSPTKNPTEHPSSSPTKNPTEHPSISPTKNPTHAPTKFPSDKPTSSPSIPPTSSPTSITTGPTPSPTTDTTFPTSSPTATSIGSIAPTSTSTAITAVPTSAPTSAPTSSPTTDTTSPASSPTTPPTDPTSIIVSNATTDPLVMKIILYAIISLIIICCGCILHLCYKHFILMNRFLEVQEDEILEVQMENNHTTDTRGHHEMLSRQMVISWLKNTVHLPQYIDLFLSQGFENMKSIQAIESKDDLRELGIKRMEHQILIFRHVKRLQLQGTDETNFGGYKLPAPTREIHSTGGEVISDSDSDSDITADTIACQILSKKKQNAQYIIAKEQYTVEGY